MPSAKPKGNNTAAPDDGTFSFFCRNQQIAINTLKAAAIEIGDVVDDEDDEDETCEDEAEIRFRFSLILISRVPCEFKTPTMHMLMHAHNAETDRGIRGTKNCGIRFNQQ